MRLHPVPDEETPREEFADAQQVLQYFIGLHRADDSCCHTHHGEYFLWGRFGEYAFQARGRSGNDRRGLPIESPDTSMEERDLLDRKSVV